MLQDTRQAGAEIEITPAMIEAGGILVAAWHLPQMPVTDMDRDMAREIYEAMRSAQVGARKNFRPA